MKDRIIIRGAREHNLKNIDLELHEGKITILLRANGCGKSILFNPMTTTLRPDRGEIILRFDTSLRWK